MNSYIIDKCVIENVDRERLTKFIFIFHIFACFVTDKIAIEISV